MKIDQVALRDLFGAPLVTNLAQIQLDAGYING